MEPARSLTDLNCAYDDPWYEEQDGKTDNDDRHACCRAVFIFIVFGHFISTIIWLGCIRNHWVKRRNVSTNIFIFITVIYRVSWLRIDLAITLVINIFIILRLTCLIAIFFTVTIINRLSLILLICIIRDINDAEIYKLVVILIIKVIDEFVAGLF